MSPLERIFSYQIISPTCWSLSNPFFCLHFFIALITIFFVYCLSPHHTISFQESRDLSYTSHFISRAMKQCLKHERHMEMMDQWPSEWMLVLLNPCIHHSPFTCSCLLGCSTTLLRDKVCTRGRVSLMTLSKILSLVDEDKPERTDY